MRRSDESSSGGAQSAFRVANAQIVETLNSSAKPLPPETAPKDEIPVVDLGAAFKIFADKVALGNQGLEAAVNQAQRAATIRHSLMLKSLNIVRKSLQSAPNICLQDRYSLELDVEDSDGWPLMKLSIFDGFNPNNQTCSLIVSANDRLSLGTILFHLDTGDIIGALHFSKENEIDLIPALTCKSLEMFFTAASHCVTSGSYPGVTAVEAKIPVGTARPAFSEKDTSDDSNLIVGDLFDDHVWTNENRLREVGDSEPLDFA